MQNLQLNPNNYDFRFHSANPVGRKNMVTYWNNFKKYWDKYEAR